VRVSPRVGFGFGGQYCNQTVNRTRAYTRSPGEHGTAVLQHFQNNAQSDVKLSGRSRKLLPMHFLISGLTPNSKPSWYISYKCVSLSLALALSLSLWVSLRLRFGVGGQSCTQKVHRTRSYTRSPGEHGTALLKYFQNTAQSNVKLSGRSRRPLVMHFLSSVLAPNS
jgi:hypothetical protein